MSQINLSAAVKMSRQIVDQMNRATVQHILFNGRETRIYASDKDKVYIPSDTGQLFHDSTHFINLVMGPFGSGKSTMCVQHIVRQACSMPIWFNGRRRARWAIVRNTSGELYSTTLQTWLTWFGELGDVHKRQKPLLTYTHTFNDGKGVVELELIFIALDRPQDVGKIKSLELTGVYLNEASELPHAVLSHFKGRVNGRYPSKAFCPEPYWSGIIADTNPPEEDHWIYEDFEKVQSPSYRIFHQPPGLLENTNGTYTQNPHCDNANNLSSDYYLKLAENQKQGFINVYCMGKYGIVESGKRVYPEYNDDIHSVESLAAIQGEPIHLGFDFGLTPSCIVVQFTQKGQLRVLKEYNGEDIGIRSFAKNVVLPALKRDFPYCKIGESEGDPAGASGDQIMEELSCIGELNDVGIVTNPASTNDIEPRIAAVRFFLNIMIDGQPGFLLSREGCPTLRKGFMNGYHFKRLAINNEERYQEKPNKNKFSHPHDGLQYISLKFATTKEKPKVDVMSVWNPVMRL